MAIRKTKHRKHSSQHKTSHRKHVSNKKYFKKTNKNVVSRNTKRIMKHNARSVVNKKSKMMSGGGKSKQHEVLKNLQKKYTKKEFEKIHKEYPFQPKYQVGDKTYHVTFEEKKSRFGGITYHPKVEEVIPIINTRNVHTPETLVAVEKQKALHAAQSVERAQEKEQRHKAIRDQAQEEIETVTPEEKPSWWNIFSKSKKNNGKRVMLIPRFSFKTNLNTNPTSVQVIIPKKQGSIYSFSKENFPHVWDPVPSQRVIIPSPQNESHYRPYMGKIGAHPRPLGPTGYEGRPIGSFYENPGGQNPMLYTTPEKEDTHGHVYAEIPDLTSEQLQPSIPEKNQFYQLQKQPPTQFVGRQAISASASSKFEKKLENELRLGNITQVEANILRENFFNNPNLATSSVQPHVFINSTDRNIFAPLPVTVKRPTNQPKEEGFLNKYNPNFQRDNTNVNYPRRRLQTVF